MRLAEYCKKNGYTLAGYQSVEKTIEKEAERIVEEIKANPLADTGVYLPADEILNTFSDNPDLTPFLIQSLKEKGVEFRTIEDPLTGEDSEYYRY